ncbi:MAG: sugar ABC transporter permease YjfF [Holophagaceae bacterium]|nr:sugar ABC transporter permease YjfF [Holophagaceae bacterium]
MKKINISTLTTKYLSVGAAVLLFFAAFITGSMLYQGFFSVQNFINLFINNSHLLVSATGMTLVILSGGIDLSVGSVLAFTTMIVASLTNAGVDPSLSIGIALLSGSLIGLSMGLIIACWNIPPFIATLAGMFFARGACYLISVQSISISNPTLRKLAHWKLGLGPDSFVSFNVILALVVIVAGIYISLYTKFGRNIYAIGGNESSAMLMGIPIKRTKVLIYTFNGFCSAVAGVAFGLSLLSGYGLHGLGMELDVIAAVVIGGTLLAGGTGYVFGSVFGVLTLGIIQALIQFNGRINSWWTKIIFGVLLLIFIGLQRFIVELGDKKSS